MDDASKGNIRNLKQTARELINREEGALHHFFTAGKRSRPSSGALDGRVSRLCIGGLVRNRGPAWRFSHMG